MGNDSERRTYHEALLRERAGALRAFARGVKLSVGAN